MQILDQDFDLILEDLESGQRYEFLAIASYLSVFYYEYSKSESILQRFSQELGIDVEFTGALGRKMRHQKDDLSHLILKVKRSVQKPLYTPEKRCALPKIARIKDDNLMNSIKFQSDDMEEVKLNTAEQAFLLVLCQVHSLTHPKDDITNEECLTYLQSIIGQAPHADLEPSDKFVYTQNPSDGSWPVLSQALYERSRREKDSARKAERALEQFEELANQYRNPIPALEDRSMQSFFLCQMPAIWTIELSQADFLLEVGATRSALDIYLRWDRWDKIILCYTKMGYREKAAELIKERIRSGEENPELYCALGDVTKDKSQYEKAWEVSNHRSARAMRSLAHFYMFDKKNHELAEPCFQKSLELNSLQTGLWFTYALDIFKEAVKYNYESEKVWENILILSAQLLLMPDCLFAYGRLLDLNSKFVDGQIIGRITHAVIEDMPSANGQKCGEFHKKLLELVARSTSLVSTDPDVWFAYSQLLLHQGTTKESYEKACQCLQRSFSCSMKAGDSAWEREAKKRADLFAKLEIWLKLLQESQQTDDKQTQAFKQLQFRSLQMNIKIILARIKSLKDNCLKLELIDEWTGCETEMQTILDKVTNLLI
ncbi:Tetratricopeptide repeat domain 27 [Cichlidogyrus casuarinus]|uniref:Tetratricopeptide repeat domain 27 n=1 Tax=Cichlidogyrus casuarinus TaxID=1844966 RepID=A0ABD2QEG4_9PLAT